MIENKTTEESPEPRYWTSYWTEKHWEPDNIEYEPVKFSGASTFRSRGVKAGDVLYVVSLKSGQLMLGGRMIIGRISSRNEALQIATGESLYDVDEWTIARPDSGTPLHLHRQLATDIAQELEFVSEKPRLKIEHGKLDPQTLRGIRQLTSESARILDDVIEMTDGRPRSKDITVVSWEDIALYRQRRTFVPMFGEIAEESAYVEGSVKRVLVNRYERDPEARQACIRHHGTGCLVCGFDFPSVYGQIAAGFIHVHHLVPLSSLRENYVVNPVEDMRPVCPNCHAMIHLRNPPYSMEEMVDFLNSRKLRAAVTS